MAYGYSVSATAGFAMLDHLAGPASVLNIFMFVVGSGVAFAGVNAAVTRGYREAGRQEPRMVVALATSLSAISISAAVGIVALLGWLIGGWAAWLLGALLGTWTYLAVAALEVALSRTVHPEAERRR
jgi:hypothetical protein